MNEETLLPKAKYLNYRNKSRKTSNDSNYRKEAC